MSTETVTIILVLTQFGSVLLFLLCYFVILRPRAKADRDALRTRINELENDNARLQGENEALRAENSELRAKIHSLKTYPTRCKYCQKRVFYFSCDHGSKVFFDKLGHPWPVHRCPEYYQRQVR